MRLWRPHPKCLYIPTSFPSGTWHNGRSRSQPKSREIDLGYVLSARRPEYFAEKRRSKRKEWEGATHKEITQTEARRVLMMGKYGSVYSSWHFNEIVCGVPPPTNYRMMDGVPPGNCEIGTKEAESAKGATKGTRCGNGERARETREPRE